MTYSQPRIACSRSEHILPYPHIAGAGDQHGADRHQQTPKDCLSARSASATLALGLPLPPACSFHERL
jgi:hypothetical protein